MTIMRIKTLKVKVFFTYKILDISRVSNKNLDTFQRFIELTFSSSIKVSQAVESRVRFIFSLTYSANFP